MPYHAGDGWPFPNHIAMFIFYSLEFLESEVEVINHLPGKNGYSDLSIQEAILADFEKSRKCWRAGGALPSMGEGQAGRGFLKSQKPVASFARMACSLLYVHFPENLTGS